MMHAKGQRGFTIIELLFAMSFLTFMLIFIITATIQTMRIYNKGVVTKQVNQSGRTIIEEMSRAIRAADPKSFSINANIGRVCFGGTSYIWNNNDPSQGTNKYSDGSPILFARVKDPGKDYCNPDNPKVPLKSEATELISDTLWVQNVQVTQSVNDPMLVQLSIRLSTASPNNPTMFVNSQKVCDNGTDGNFCAVNDFTTIVAIRNIGS